MNDGYKVLSEKPIVEWVDPQIIGSNLDSNYYKQSYLMVREQIMSGSHATLGDIAVNGRFFTGNTPNYSEEETDDNNIRLLKTVNVLNNEIDTSKRFFITETDNEGLKRSQLADGDIVITVIGATEDVIGRTVVYRGYYGKANITQSLSKFSVKEKYDRYFISTYLNCKYGHNLILQMASSSTRCYINNSDLARVLVPLYPKEIQKFIGDKIRKAEELREKAQRLKSEADSIMNSEILGITVNKSTAPNSLFKWISNNSIDTLRLDSAYYGDKYMEMEQIIKRLPNITLGDIAEELQDGPGGWAINTDDYINEGIPIIRGINIGEQGEFIADDFVYISPEKNNELKRSQVLPGHIVLSVRGTIGKSAVVPETIKIANLNAAVVKIKIKGDILDAYYLVGFLNSPIGRLQTSRIANGAVQLNMNLTECKANLIPIPPMELQVKFREKFIGFLQATEKSKQLIQEAKQDVEDLIEGRFDKPRITG